MSNLPLSPNFTPGIGHLTTTRWDFEQHIQGTNFRQQASTVDVVPAITIDGYPIINNLQEAISVLSQIANPLIPLATSSTFGVVKLSSFGDVQGSAGILKVVNIQGIPISTSAPINGDVLTFNGTSWIPQLPSNSFTAAGDLTGSAISQTVTGITGSSGSVKIHCNDILWDYSTNPVITMAPTSTGIIANTLSIIGQTSTVSNGGNVVIQGGGYAIGNFSGGVSLQFADSTPAVQIAEVAGNNRVVALCNTSPLNITNTPYNSGDMVVFIANAVTNPTTGIPAGGSILYSSAADSHLHVKDATGNDFALGSVSNPSAWGSLVSLVPSFLPGGEVYTVRAAATSPIGSTTSMFTVALPDLTATNVEVTFVGHYSTTNSGMGPTGGLSAQYTLKMGYERYSSSPTAVGTVTTVDSRTIATGVWTAPTITVSGNNLVITSGAHGTYAISWVASIKLIFIQ